MTESLGQAIADEAGLNISKEKIARFDAAVQAKIDARIDAMFEDFFSSDYFFEDWQANPALHEAVMNLPELKNRKVLSFNEWRRQKGV